MARWKSDHMTDDQIVVQVSRVWDLFHGSDYPGPVPLLDAVIKCPVCGEVDPWNLLIRHWKYHQPQRRVRSRVLYRCDVGFKCCVCSAVWVHGVPIPEWYWKRRARNVGRDIRWNDD